MSAESMRSHVMGNDVISQLSDHIIGHILGFMSLPDAAKTSVVSREWRFKWLNVSRIICYVSGGPRTRIDKLLSGILGMLRAHDGAILEFVMVGPGLESCNEIDEILKLVYKKGVRKILFGASKGKPHVLDSSLFSCAQLSHLALDGCIFQPQPELTGFTATNLNTLFFFQVSITAQLLSTLISQSPSLHCLSLANSDSFNDQLEVTAPNLNLFHFHAHFKALIYVAAPRLKQLTMTLPYKRSNVMQHNHDSTMLHLKSVNSIERLHLDYYYIKSLYRCGSRFKFENLRVLRLSAICFGITHEVKCMLELMISCASLEKIIIEAFHVAAAEQQDDDATFGEALDLSRSRIREVQMLDMSGSKTELAFVETMLLKLLKLETMVIAPDGGFNIRKLASRFRRTLPLATIEFRYSDACKDPLNHQYSQSLMTLFKM